MTGYHVTTPHKLARYRATGCILPPVRFWYYERSARDWGRRVGCSVILRIEAGEHHPLPDHRPRGHAAWTPRVITTWEEL
jgi:hypothetical protein